MELKGGALACSLVLDTYMKRCHYHPDYTRGDMGQSCLAYDY